MGLNTRNVFENFENFFFLLNKSQLKEEKNMTNEKTYASVCFNSNFFFQLTLYGTKLMTMKKFIENEEKKSLKNAQTKLNLKQHKRIALMCISE